MNDEELLRALKALPRETEPPHDLEERIAARLWPGTERRLPAGRSAGILPALRYALAAAVAVAAFLGGYVLARIEPQPTHVLFVHRQQTPLTPEQSRARVAEYGAWARNLAGGEKLTADTWLLEGARVDAAAPEISGYFLLRASDDAEALRIAKTCPHLKHGGRVELRRIQR